MTDEAEHDDQKRLFPEDPACELSSNRTAMSFQRTAMSSDRTLMSVVRTSLSLIGFGFTIYQFFHSLNEEFGRVPTGTSQRFALILISLGMLLLILGIGNHIQETRGRRRRRQRLYDQGLIAHVEPVRVSSVTVIAILLFVAGLLAFMRVGFTLGPL